MSEPTNDRHCLRTDNDGHYFVIPADKIGEWDKWTELDPEDERAWEAPEWAVRVGGSPGEVYFGSFTVWGKSYS